MVAVDYFFLLKVGYEPLPPTLGRNIFGRQVYQLPGLFAYGECVTYKFCKLIVLCNPCLWSRSRHMF